MGLPDLWTRVREDAEVCDEILTSRNLDEWQVTIRRRVEALTPYLRMIAAKPDSDAQLGTLLRDAVLAVEAELLADDETLWQNLRSSLAGEVLLRSEAQERPPTEKAEIRTMVEVLRGTERRRTLTTGRKKQGGDRKPRRKPR